jgi:SAM-dependent methyltransferase
MTAEPLPGAGQAGEVLRLFDAKAAGWAAKYAQGGPLAGRKASLCATVSRYARTGDLALDLGCGTGDLARALAANGLHVTGCDISRQMLLRAAGPPGPRGPDLRTGWVQLEPDWRRLPLASAAFDVVVAASVLEYVAEPAAVLLECARVLRPGGVVLYTVPDVRHPVRWAEWLARPLARMLGAPPVGGRRSWWHSYHAYLRASRQRHLLRWWLAASAAAHLHPVRPADLGTPSPLRLLVFRQAEHAEARP